MNKKNKTALIGSTGFVGSNLALQFRFGHQFNSSNISKISHQEYDLIICAGMQAKKWWANQNEAEDLAGINKLLECLKTVTAKQFVLISTVDVYPNPAGVNEMSFIDYSSNHAYGKHRFMAEEYIRSHFANHLILRLPGLFGTGIKKNAIHDLLNNHELEKINPAGVYQYYFLDNLKADIQRAQEMRLDLLNISVEPITTKDVVNRFFPSAKVGEASPFMASYDMKSVYWKEWGCITPGYLYDQSTVLDQLQKFIERELAVTK
jgi:nucleoside-diphosphate-sugar epimerase